METSKVFLKHFLDVSGVKRAFSQVTIIFFIRKSTVFNNLTDISKGKYSKMTSAFKLMSNQMR